MVHKYNTLQLRLHEHAIGCMNKREQSRTEVSPARMIGRILGITEV
jgi:hypothetical protein